MDPIVIKKDAGFDVLNPLAAAGKKVTGSVEGTIRAGFPEKLLVMIEEIGCEGDNNGVNVFLVGGFVRDLMLGVKNYDLDLVVEGDAIAFGEKLKTRLGGTLVRHEKFGTATLVKNWPAWLGPPLHPDNKFKIDIATARREKYARPAALPEVRPSTLKQDLYRRDFTINAMAVKINKADFGLFVDLFGGMDDLRKKMIRVLHDRSFIDDPTRIFRAVRFEQRLGFSIEKHTGYLIRHAIKQGMFKRTGNQRIRDELILILNEKDPGKAVSRMRQLHELRFIHPSIRLPVRIKSIFADIRKAVKWYNANAARKRTLDVWLIYFLVMLDSLDPRETEEVIDRFVFQNSVNASIRSYKKRAGTVIRKLAGRTKNPPSDIYKLLEPLSHEVTICIMAKTGSGKARRGIKRFFTKYDGTELKVKGRDIKRSGVKPGPLYKDILRKVLYEKLDGKLPDKRSELSFMKKMIRESRW